MKYINPLTSLSNASKVLVISSIRSCIYTDCFSETIYITISSITNVTRSCLRAKSVHCMYTIYGTDTIGQFGNVIDWNILVRGLLKQSQGIIQIKV